MIQDIQYAKTSWGLLTSKPGWIKHVLVLSLLMFIPIIGQIALFGYIYSWARRTAWGMRTSPVETKIDTSEIMRIGFATFLITMVLSLILSIVLTIINSATAWIPVIGILISIAANIASYIVITIFALFCVLYVIYRKADILFKVSDIWEMLNKDWRGIVKISVLGFIMGFVITTIVSIIGLVVYLPMIGTFLMSDAVQQGMISAASTGDISDGVVHTIALYALSGGLPIAGILIVTPIILFIAFIGNVVSQLVYCNAVGIWVSQFNPSVWGGLNEPDPLRLRTPHSYLVKQQAPSTVDAQEDAEQQAEQSAADKPVVAEPADKPQASAEPEALEAPAASTPAAVAPVAQPKTPVADQPDEAEQPEEPKQEQQTEASDKPKTDE